MVSTEPPKLAVGSNPRLIPISVGTMPARSHPVKYAVVDDATEVRWANPHPPNWSGWEARYDNDVECGKRASRDFIAFPDDVLRLSGDLTSAPVTAAIADAFGFDPEQFVHDPTWHGGGVHVTEPGGWLNCHLDYALHPYIPDMRRAVNLIVFLHDRWEQGWGGEFYLADGHGKPVEIIEPRPGRAILFETSDVSYHGVLPVTGPMDRVSLAIYYLAPAGPETSRLRALFMPTRRK